MSHFTTVEAQIKDKGCLIQALRDLGFEPEVYDTPQPIEGWRGSRSNLVANIILRRKLVGAFSDVGFLWNSKTNSYEVLLDDMDTKFIKNNTSTPTIDKSFISIENGKPVGRLLGAYVKNVVMQQARRMGMNVVHAGRSNGVDTYRLQQTRR